MTNAPIQPDDTNIDNILDKVLRPLESVSNVDTSHLKRVAKVAIKKSYISRREVAEAIGGDEPQEYASTNASSAWASKQAEHNAVRNIQRARIREALNLDQPQGDKHE